MELEDFQQEYELSCNDESQTYFPYDLIFPCCRKEMGIFHSIARIVSETKSDLYAEIAVGRNRLLYPELTAKYVGLKEI